MGQSADFIVAQTEFSKLNEPKKSLEVEENGEGLAKTECDRGQFTTKQINQMRDTYSREILDLISVEKKFF